MRLIQNITQLRASQLLNSNINRLNMPLSEMITTLLQL